MAFNPLKLISATVDGPWRLWQYQTDDSIEDVRDSGGYFVRDDIRPYDYVVIDTPDYSGLHMLMPIKEDHFKAVEIAGATKSLLSSARYRPVKAQGYVVMQINRGLLLGAAEVWVEMIVAGTRPKLTTYTVFYHNLNTGEVRDYSGYRRFQDALEWVLSIVRSIVGES